MVEEGDEEGDVMTVGGESVRRGGTERGTKERRRAFSLKVKNGEYEATSQEG